VSGTAHAELDAPTTEQVQSGEALGCVQGMMHGREDNREPQTHLRRALAQGRENHVWRAGVRLLGGEMMLHKPDACKPHLFGIAHLRQDVLK
jgi:hypothetical protein